MSRIRAIAVGLVALSVLGAAGSAGAATDLKTFTLDVDGTTAGVAPGVWSGDTDATVRVRLTNTTANQSLGSANLTVPAPFRLVAAPADATPGGPVVQLRNLGLAPGQSLEVALTVAVETCAPATVGPFAMAVKQSNDFNGTGNDFVLAGPSDLTVESPGVCGLAFVASPGDAERGAAITSVPFDPAGAPVRVEVRDAGGTGRATHSTATVALAAANPAVPSPVLGGTTTTAAVAGLATFSPGPTLGIAAFGYTLTASSSGLTDSPVSPPFDVPDDRVACPAGGACSRASASKGAQTVSVDFGAGGTAANLLLSIDAADAPAFACAGYPRPAGTYVTQFIFTGGSAADRTGSMASVIPNATKPLNEYEACWAAPYPFTTEAGTPAAVGATKPGTGEPLYVGLLPDCPKKDTAYKPCVSGRSYDRRTRAATVTVRASGDDPWRY